MPDIVSKSPEENYASRSEGAVSNIRYPTENGPPVAGQEALARTRLGDQQLNGTVTAINGTTIRANVDAAMVAQGATACNNAGARAAIAAVITDQLLLANTTQTVEAAVSFDT